MKSVAFRALAVSRSARVRDGQRALHVLHAPLPRRPAVVHGRRATRPHRDELSADDARRAVREARAAVGADHRPGRRHASARAARVLPQARIDVVEIDPAVVRVARKLFRFRDGQQRCSVIESGRPGLREARAAGAAALRPDHARCVRSRIHSRASADAGIPEGGESRCWRRTACSRQTRSRRAASTITSRRPMRRCFRSSSI